MQTVAGGKFHRKIKLNKNRKLIVLAVAGALNAPAASMAQSSNVQLYGKLDVTYGYYDNGGRGFAAPSTISNGVGIPPIRYDAISDNESEWGLKGEESLGGSMSAWFQCASPMDAFSGTSAGPTNTMCSRNSALGLKSAFGNLFLGNWDTPTKTAMSRFLPFGLFSPMGAAAMFNASGPAGSIIGPGSTSPAGSLGNGTPASLAGGLGTFQQATFARRQKNLVTYISPTWNGLEFQGAYSATNEASTITSAATIQKPRLYSFALNYSNGPLLLGIGYERHKDYNPSFFSPQISYTGGKDSSLQVGVAYTFMGSLKVSAVYVNLQDELHANPANSSLNGDLTQTNYGLFADWAIAGPHRVRMGWFNLGSTKGTLGRPPFIFDNIGALQVTGANGNAGGSKVQPGIRLCAVETHRSQPGVRPSEQ